MAFKSIMEFKKDGRQGGSKLALDAIFYKTSHYKGQSPRCLIIIPVPISKRAGIEPNTLVNVEYDAELKICRLSLGNKNLLPRVSYHGKNKNYVKIEFKLYDKWLPRHDVAIEIKQYEYKKGITFPVS